MTHHHILFRGAASGLAQRVKQVLEEAPGLTVRPLSPAGSDSAISVSGSVFKEVFDKALGADLVSVDPRKTPADIVILGDNGRIEAAFAPRANDLRFE